jgi:drug/metabolite transporter (DMT)-like permease
LAEFHAATPALPATQMSATTTPPDTSDAIARQRSIGVLAVLAAVLFFSISSTLIKWADAPGPAIAFWRMVVAVGAWWTVLLIHHLRTGAPLPSRETWRRVTPAGLFFGANIALFFTAIKMTSVAHAEFIGALTPLILLPIGARFFHEPPNWKALRWGILSVAGVIIVLLGGDGGGASSVAGDALMLVVLSLWIGYMLSTKIARQANISTLHFMSCAIPIAVLSAGSISIFLVGGEIMPTTARAWLAIVILAVITGVGAHGHLVFAQRFVPVATIGIMQVAQPAIASFWAWLILGETVTTLQVPGMMLVIVGLTIFTIVSQRRAVLPVIIAQPPDLDGE